MTDIREILKQHEEWLENYRNGKQITTRSMKFRGREFRYTNLKKALLNNADLDTTDLTGANLEEAKMDTANLSHANLNKANLKNADLRNSTMRNTRLQDADLTNANLQGAYMINTDLTNANLDGADLRYIVAIDLFGQRIISVQFTTETTSGLINYWADLGIWTYRNFQGTTEEFKEYYKDNQYKKRYDRIVDFIFKELEQEEELKLEEINKDKKELEDFMKDLKKQLSKVYEMDKAEFLKFFNQYYTYEGSEEGLLISSLYGSIEVPVFYTNLDTYEALKLTDDYKKITDNYTEEQIEEYENKLKQAMSDLIYNNSYNLNLYDENLEINEIVLDYYFKHEEELDTQALYDAKDFIKEETEEQIEELGY